MGDSVKKSVLSEVVVGDMLVVYYLAEKSQQVEWLLVPKAMKAQMKEIKFSRGSSLVQIKLVGDAYPGAYAGGLTLLNSETVEKYFKYDKQEVSQEANQITIHTYLKDERGLVLIHHLNYKEGNSAVTVWTTFRNKGAKRVTLELLSSFCMTEITPFEEGSALYHLKLHRIRSKWSQEGRLCTEAIEDLQLEPNWCKWQPQSERFGQVGSLPVKKFFPFMAVEDTYSKVIWGVQLGCESSWQMELYRRDDALCMCGGLPDREFGQWMKHIETGESFETPQAVITACCGDIDHVTQRLTRHGEQFVNAGPESEQNLPVLFNEYCTTWGLPSHENIEGIVNSIRGKGIDYFVVDCGWFVEEGKNWSVSMGDYRPSPKLFPKGMGKTVSLIKSAGMKPGIWFEIDNIGHEAEAYEDEAHLLKRDGYVLTTGNRRFWDMRQNWVQEDLAKKVIGQIKQFGFEYMKMDYNDTIGLGCDGAESLGEGLRQNMEASVKFVERVKAEVPGIVLENCASGGHKLEPLMMSLCSMASFSDAHECEEIPVIAANLHRCILPRQSQIWAVIRKEASLKRIAYVLSSTFLGRMCLSGDVTALTHSQWQLIDDAICFYKKVVPVIKNGYSYFYGDKKSSDRVLEGWQAVVRVQTEEGLLERGMTIYEGEHSAAVITIHTFGGDLPEYIEIPLPEGCPEQVIKTYSDAEVEISIKDHVLRYKTSEGMKGIGIYLAK